MDFGKKKAFGLYLYVIYMNTSYTPSIKPRESYYNSKTLIMNIPMNGIGSK